MAMVIPMNRRYFLKSAAAVGTASLLGVNSVAAEETEENIEYTDDDIPVLVIDENNIDDVAEIDEGWWVFNGESLVELEPEFEDVDEFKLRYEENEAIHTQLEVGSLFDTGARPQQIRINGDRIPVIGEEERDYIDEQAIYHIEVYELTITNLGEYDEITEIEHLIGRGYPIGEQIELGIVPIFY